MSALKFPDVDADTVARLAVGTLRELDTLTIAHSPESNATYRRMQKQLHMGLDYARVPADIMKSVSRICRARNIPADAAMDLMLKIAIRFGMRLQQNIEKELERKTT